MEETLKERIARQAGLSADQMRTFEELSDEERAEVEWQFGLFRADSFLYAVKADGGLVARRWRFAPRGGPLMSLPGRDG